MNRLKIRSSKIMLYDTIYLDLPQELIKDPTKLLETIELDYDKKITIESIIYNINDDKLKQKYIKQLKLLYVNLIKNCPMNWQKIIYRFEYYLLNKQKSFNYIRNKALLYLILTNPPMKLTNIVNLKLDNYVNGTLYGKELDENVIKALNEHIKINNINGKIFDVCNISCIANMLDHVLGCSINKIRSMYYDLNKNT